VDIVHKLVYYGSEPEFVGDSLAEREQPWDTERVDPPIFSTRDLHLGYVDCVAFVGDLILSKSVEDVIELWLPDYGSREVSSNPPPSDLKLLWSYKYKDADSWYMRFAVDPAGRTLAVGTTEGQVYIWDIDKSDLDPIVRSVKGGRLVRSLAFSPDGKILVAITECRRVVRWDISRNKSDPSYDSI
jgi:polycomb protein EED